MCAVGRTPALERVGDLVYVSSTVKLGAGVLGVGREAIVVWREIDVAAEIETATGLPVSLYDDDTAACAAELIAGDRILRRSAL